LKTAQADLENKEARAEFYRLLMASKVFVAGKKEHEENGKPHIQVKHWVQPDGKMAMPFFARLDSLKDTLGDDEEYVEIPVVDLFKMSAGTTLVLTTPDGGKDFKADEVATLLRVLLKNDLICDALANAQNDAQAVGAFYSVLLNAKIYVLGHGGETPLDAPKGQMEEKTITKDDKLSFATITTPMAEGPVVPFFSSLELLAKAAKQEGAPYMVFTGVDFFKMAVAFEHPLLLNPGHELYHLFTTGEIEHIVKYAKVAPPKPLSGRVLPPGMKVFFSAPENYPYSLVDALCDFLPSHPEVTAAYLTIMRENSEDASQALVIGFEGENHDEIIKMFTPAADIAAGHAEEGLPIDFALIRKNEEGVSRHFIDKVEPFYRKRLPKANS
ncbi:MAG: enhanced serine sensitivity protein SseB C-terminal domain-containing protein, partial [Candidatus Adiutrix sp.]